MRFTLISRPISVQGVKDTISTGLTQRQSRHVPRAQIQGGSPGPSKQPYNTLTTARVAMLWMRQDQLLVLLLLVVLLTMIERWLGQT